jgi:nucleoside-diphosphate-sugar epimerase
MRILVTGGSGFIGRAVARELDFHEHLPVDDAHEGKRRVLGVQPYGAEAVVVDELGLGRRSGVRCCDDGGELRHVRPSQCR